MNRFNVPENVPTFEVFWGSGETQNNKSNVLLLIERTVKHEPQRQPIDANLRADKNSRFNLPPSCFAVCLRHFNLAGVRVFMLLRTFTRSKTVNLTAPSVPRSPEKKGEVTFHSNLLLCLLPPPPHTSPCPWSVCPEIWQMASQMCTNPARRKDVKMRPQRRHSGSAHQSMVTKKRGRCPPPPSEDRCYQLFKVVRHVLVQERRHRLTVESKVALLRVSD